MPFRRVRAGAMATEAVDEAAINLEPNASEVGEIRTVRQGNNASRQHRSEHNESNAGNGHKEKHASSLNNSNDNKPCSKGASSRTVAVSR